MWSEDWLSLFCCSRILSWGSFTHWEKNSKQLLHKNPTEYLKGVTLCQRVPFFSLSGLLILAERGKSIDLSWLIDRLVFGDYCGWLFWSLTTINLCLRHTHLSCLCGRADCVITATLMKFWQFKSTQTPSFNARNKMMINAVMTYSTTGYPQTLLPIFHPWGQNWFYC